MRELEAAGYGPEAYLRIITGQIGRIGWAVQGVPGDEQWPSWAYGIGLWHTFRAPELALFGLSLPNMAAIINALGRRIADGGTIAAGTGSRASAPVPSRSAPCTTAGGQPACSPYPTPSTATSGRPTSKSSGRTSRRPPVGTGVRGQVRGAPAAAVAAPWRPPAVCLDPDRQPSRL